MTQRAIVQFFCNLCTKTIEGEPSHVQVGVNGKVYSFDLCPTDAANVQAWLDTLISAGDEVGYFRAMRKPPSPGTQSSGLPKSDLAKIRQWARDNGIPVHATGRVPQRLIDQYTTAQQRSRKARKRPSSKA